MARWVAAPTRRSSLARAIGTVAYDLMRRPYSGPFPDNDVRHREVIGATRSLGGSRSHDRARHRRWRIHRRPPGRSPAADGHDVRAVDVKPVEEWYQVHESAENVVADCSDVDAHKVADGTDEIYNLAADMGGMGFIENNKADCMLSVLINTHMLVAAREAGTKRFFYSSSACVYNGEKQTDPKVTALAEADAYPAMPEDGYGWEKLFSERMCRHFREDFGLETRWPGTTTSTARTAPGTAAARRRPPRSAARSPRSPWAAPRDRDLGRRRADPQLHVHRRLRARHHGDLAGDPRANQPRLGRAGHDQPAGRHRRGDRRRQGRAQLRARRPPGRPGTQQRQHHVPADLGWEPSICLQEGLEQTYGWIHDQLQARG